WECLHLLVKVGGVVAHEDLKAPRTEICHCSGQVSMLRKSFSPILYPDQVDACASFSQLNALVSKELESQFLLNLKELLHICSLRFSARPGDIVSIIVIAKDGKLAHRCP